MNAAALDRLFARLESAQVVEAWSALSWPRRSSRYFFARHGVTHGRAYESALTKLSAAAAPALLARRGRIQRLLGRREQALADFDRALALSPDDDAAQAWRWETLLAQGRGGGPPWTDIDRAVALAPENPWWRVWRAIGILSLAKRRRARLRSGLADCAVAASLAPRCALARLVQAAIHERLGQAGAARRALDAALRIDPSLYFAYLQRGRLRLAAGDSRGFMADHDRAVRYEERAGYFTGTIGGQNIAPSAPQPRVSLLCGAVAFPARGSAAAPYWIAALRRADASRSLPRIAAACGTILAREPRAYWIYALRGNCRRQPELDDLPGALADFKAAVSLKPRCAWAWAYLSRVHMTTAAQAPALEAIGRAVSLDPACGWLHVWRGEVRRWFGDLKGSLADFDRGLALSPDYEFGYAWRGGAKRALRRPKAALEDLTMAVRLEPGYAWALDQRSRALRDLGRVGEALASLDLAHALDSRYLWCAAPRRADAALLELDAALLKDPSDARAYAWRGETLSRLGRGPQAKADLDRCLALDPGHARALAWRGWVNAGLGLLDEALGDFDRSLALEGRQAQALARRGRLRHRSGESVLALQDLDSAIALEPQAMEPLEWRAEILVQRQDWKRAKADLDRILDRDQGNLRALALRARALARLGQAAEARADLARARQGATPP